MAARKLRDSDDKDSTNMAVFKNNSLESRIYSTASQCCMDSSTKFSPKNSLGAFTFYGVLNVLITASILKK